MYSKIFIESFSTAVDVGDKTVNKKAKFKCLGIYITGIKTDNKHINIQHYIRNQ